jgi:hypothetical protein
MLEVDHFSIGCLRIIFMLQMRPHNKFQRDMPTRPLSRFRLAAGFAGVLLAASWTAGATADDGEPVATFDNWSVVQSQAQTPGGGHCIVVHRRYGAIRVYDNVLVILLPETPRGYQYRIDANTISGMKLASQTEQQTSSVGIAGSAFSELQTGELFRAEILTYTKVLEVELDLAGLADAIVFLAQDPACRA